MIILRIKSFAIPQNPQQGSPTPPPQLQQSQKPGQLLIEQMKTEREALKNLRKKQEMEAKEKQAKIRNVIRQQAEDRKEKMDSMKERAKAIKNEQQNNSPSNTYLYKSKSVPTPPVPMK